MRIGITGTHGTGKTTLANLLAERLGIPIITERAREAAQRLGFERTSEVMNSSLGDIYRFQQLIYELQLEQEYQYQNVGFISDRTTIDFASYMALWAGDNNYRNPDYRNYYTDCLHHARHNYDVIFYVPIEFELEDDGFRATCPVCRRVHDGLINYFFNAYNLTNLKYRVFGSTEERVGMAQAYIQLLEQHLGQQQRQRRGVHVATGFDQNGNLMIRHDSPGYYTHESVNVDERPIPPQCYYHELQSENPCREIPLSQNTSQSQHDKNLCSKDDEEPSIYSIEKEESLSLYGFVNEYLASWDNYYIPFEEEPDISAQEGGNNNG